MSVIRLNDGQEKVAQEACDWYHYGSDQIFQYAGFAGTGKSVVMYDIVRRLGLQPKNIMPMAYTGQASIIMRLKGFPNARSIHSNLYRIEKVQNEYQDNPFRNINTMLNAEKTHFEFAPINMGEIPSEVKLMIIDEGFMVPESMRRDITKHGIKILVAGDPGQLPPIGGNPAFLASGKVRYLTELMRQAKDNPIIYIAHRAREGLPIHCGMYGNRVLVIEDKDLTNEMVLDVGNIICGTNKTRDSFNNTIRKLKGIDSQIPLFGERIICRNNNWNIEMDGIALANGLAGYVTSPYEISRYNRAQYTLDFLPDLLNTPFRNINIDYEYLTSPYDVRQQMKNNRSFSNGEKFEFAYALTTHLSQGAEYPCGIYYEEFLRSNIQNQLNYTGITRFKEFFIYVKKSKKYY